MWTQGPLRHTGRRPCDEGGRDWSRGHQPRDSSGSTGSQKRQKGPSPAAPGVWPCTHLDFGCLASRALRQNTSVIGSYPIRRDLLRQPEDTHVINLAPRLLQEGLLGRQHRQPPSGSQQGPVHNRPSVSIPRDWHLEVRVTWGHPRASHGLTGMDFHAKVNGTASRSSPRVPEMTSVISPQCADIKYCPVISGTRASSGGKSHPNLLSLPQHHRALSSSFPQQGGINSNKPLRCSEDLQQPQCACSKGHHVSLPCDGQTAPSRQSPFLGRGPHDLTVSTQPSRTCSDRFLELAAWPACTPATSAKYHPRRGGRRGPGRWDRCRREPSTAGPHSETLQYCAFQVSSSPRGLGRLDRPLLVQVRKSRGCGYHGCRCARSPRGVRLTSSSGGQAE